MLWVVLHFGYLILTNKFLLMTLISAADPKRLKVGASSVEGDA